MADLCDFDLADVELTRINSGQLDTNLSFHPFPRLPYELRLDIIEEWIRSRGDHCWTPGDMIIVGPCSTWRQPTRLRNPFAEYATIDKQWKFAVEKHTFRSLTFVIPEFGKNTSLDDSESFYRSDVYEAFDNPDTLDDFERICIEERVNAVLEIQLSINIHDGMRRPRTWSSLRTMFTAAGQGENTEQ